MTMLPKAALAALTSAAALALTGCAVSNYTPAQGRTMRICTPYMAGEVEIRSGDPALRYFTGSLAERKAALNVERDRICD